MLIGEETLCALSCDAYQCDAGFECASASANGVGVNVCVFSGDVCCPSGTVDLDGDASNGCEYICETNQRGAEICDETDNDCDGSVDEGFDFSQNTLHCGECGNSCVRDNMIAACVDGECGNQCEPGFLNADGADANGCEAICDVDNATSEICDGVDNDCDGPVDEAFPTLGSTCDITIGLCPATGTFVCSSSGDGVSCDATADLTFAQANSATDLIMTATVKSTTGTISIAMLTIADDVVKFVQMQPMHSPVANKLSVVLCATRASATETKTHLTAVSPTVVQRTTAALMKFAMEKTMIMIA